MDSRNESLLRTKTSPETEARQKRCFPPWFYYSLLGMWMFGSMVALFLTGIFVVRPYYQADKMIATECSTATVSRGMGTFKCFCGKGCDETCQVNCTFVQVTYSSPINNGSNRIGKLSHVEYDLDRECYRSSFSIKCKDCWSTHYDFMPPNGTFNCWIDPENNKVLEIKYFNTMSVFHAIFWPLLSLVLSICVCARYCARKS